MARQRSRLLQLQHGDAALAVKLRHAITELAVLQSREDATRPAGTRGVDGGGALLFSSDARLLASPRPRRHSTTSACAGVPDRPERTVFRLPSRLE